MVGGGLSWSCPQAQAKFADLPCGLSPLWPDLFLVGIMLLTWIFFSISHTFYDSESILCVLSGQEVLATFQCASLSSLTMSKYRLSLLDPAWTFTGQDQVAEGERGA